MFLKGISYFLYVFKASSPQNCNDHVSEKSCCWKPVFPHVPVDLSIWFLQCTDISLPVGALMCQAVHLECNLELCVLITENWVGKNKSYDFKVRLASGVVSVTSSRAGQGEDGTFGLLELSSALLAPNPSRSPGEPISLRITLKYLALSRGTTRSQEAHVRFEDRIVLFWCTFLEIRYPPHPTPPHPRLGSGWIPGLPMFSLGWN